jgi:hypothetical protein
LTRGGQRGIALDDRATPGTRVSMVNLLIALNE